jgi:hypothetical protein
MLKVGHKYSSGFGINVLIGFAYVTDGAKA